MGAHGKLYSRVACGVWPSDKAPELAHPRYAPMTP